MSSVIDASYEERLLASLKEPLEAAAYRSAAIDTKDRASLLLALRQVAKVHGMAEVARSAEIGDKTLFKALSENGNPTLETVTKVLFAMGLRLNVEPIPA